MLKVEKKMFIFETEPSFLSNGRSCMFSAIQWLSPINNTDFLGLFKRIRFNTVAWKISDFHAKCTWGCKVLELPLLNSVISF